MNIVQMMQNMMNPVKKNNMQFSENELKEKLKLISDDQLKQLANQAAMFGINQTQINEGLKFIQSLR